MQSLDKSIESLVESYRSQGLINNLAGGNLPSRESVSEILRNLEELLFPGYRKNEALDHNNLYFITAEKVYRTARDLTREVEKSMAFAMRAEHKDLDEGDPRGREGCHFAAGLVVETFFKEFPRIRSVLGEDMKAAFRGDPAAKSYEEVIVSYPGFEAITVHRLAHFFWKAQVPLIPRMMSELAHSRTGIDIHPGASIGGAFFVDHGTGVVVGETTVIGKNVKLYQGVTLGALSVKKEEGNRKRHPTIEDDVTIYSNAIILGGDTVIGHGSVIGGSVWITSPVPPLSTVYVKSGEQLIKPLAADRE
jgi:serine O-acetyltransferase